MTLKTPTSTKRTNSATKGDGLLSSMGIQANTFTGAMRWALVMYRHLT
ncbi:hypothetical protein MLPF_2397 [Mycobacterium lepromatosis]|nr:hypothetical protein MLPF_2397 [Mycobacterium lepromatosis]